MCLRDRQVYARLPGTDLIIHSSFVRVHDEEYPIQVRFLCRIGCRSMKYLLTIFCLVSSPYRQRVPESLHSPLLHAPSQHIISSQLTPPPLSALLILLVISIFLFM